MTLEDGPGIQLGAEYKFSERLGLQIDFAQERTELKADLFNLREDVDLFTVGLGTAFHLTPFRRFDIYIEPRIQYRFSREITVPDISSSDFANFEDYVNFLEMYDVNADGSVAGDEIPGASEIPEEVEYGARLGIAFPVNFKALIGCRWLVDLSVEYHHVHDRISFGIGLSKEFSPRK